MIAVALLGALADLPLLRALEAHGGYALAWLAAAALVALRRRASASPAAWFAWLPIVAFGVLLGLDSPPQSFGPTRAAPASSAAEERQENAAWEPRAGPRGTHLAPASWRELQAELARQAGGTVAIDAPQAPPQARSELLVPPAWVLPSGVALALPEPTGTAEERPSAASWWLEHAASVPPRRDLRIAARAVDVPATDRGTVALQLRSEPSAPWRELGRVERREANDRAVFELEAPEPGDYAVRLLDVDTQRELVRSALTVAPAPRARVLGGSLEALSAALRAQGYDVRDGGVPEEEDALVLVGTGAAALFGAPELARFLEQGGGVLLAHPSAWEDAQANGWEERLPARLLPEPPPAESPPTPRADQPRAEEPIDAPPQPEEADAGRFALFVVLDLSGSFADAVSEAWAQIATALRAAEGFELTGIAGFNVDARLLLPLGAHGERLSSELEAVRPRLRSYVEAGGRHTYLTPALRLAADELAREAPAGALIVVVSDGIFDDRPEQGGDWQRFAQSVLSFERGYALAAIRIADARLPSSALQSGLRRMDRFAEIGGTKKAVLRSDLGSALRMIPVVARDVQTASAWSPRNSGAKPPVPPREDPEPEREPPRPPEAQAPLVPRSTGMHAAEGLPGELDAAPWPALMALRRCALSAGAAPAWLVDPRAEPLLVTGVHARGRIAVAAAALDANGWPEAVRDPRFPLFAARLADVLRRPEPEAEAWRARQREARVLVEPATRSELANTWLSRAMGSEASAPWIGSARVDRSGLVQSTLRPSTAPATFEGERNLSEVLREASGERASQPLVASERRAPGAAPGDWLAGLGLLLGLALAIEGAATIWARSRAGAR
ncbi:MAG: VWA domain-containing protein [Planctomycetes bacterium]|nr:VWA domain-containing protein [Planctomycetota bacterium]